MQDPNRTVISGDLNKTLMGAPPTVVGTSIQATQTIKPIQCPVCRTFNPVGMFFCNECGLIFDRALDGDAFGAPTVSLPVLVDSNGREYPLRPGDQSIGRQGHIEIDDTRVSRRHAQLTLDGDTVWVEDLGSTNGTKVGGQRIAAKTELGTQTLSLGGFELNLRQPGTANKTAMPSTGQTQSMAAAPTTRTALATWMTNDGRSFELYEGDNPFGRKDDNPIAIAEAFVSGRHGVVVIGPDRTAAIADIGSTNGTTVNGTRLTPHEPAPITPDDVVALGHIELRLVWR